jgi:hypothetical protein
MSAPVTFLPGVPKEHVLHRLRQAGGDEIVSGKLASAESSAVLAMNAFGWFIPRSRLFPMLPGTEAAGAASRVEVEYCARFPWSGGKHPWLDAIVITDTHLIGVESKRYEPFRDSKRPQFSFAYDRPGRGSNMERYHAVRRGLIEGSISYHNLDAAQLTKHAYGLVTEAKRLRKAPLLHYIFAEPCARGGQTITAADHWQHRAEIADFGARVAGDDVGFSSCSYREWIETWQGPQLKHALSLAKAFAP